MHRLLFELRYLLGKTPWDSGITPPEVMTFLQAAPPGRALDLGCGTGTSSIELARSGWQVVGVDLSFWAIQRARRKAHRAGISVDFRVTPVEKVLELPNLGLFDLILDIGCFHSLGEQVSRIYGTGVKNLTKEKGILLLYGFFDPEALEASLRPLFTPEFEIIDFSPGQDTATGRTSAWITLRRGTA